MMGFAQGAQPILQGRPHRLRRECGGFFKIHHTGGSMAEMIPDRLPSGASAGEKKVFALLQQLPDDVIVYYEPVVANRYPDFIVIMPSVGLLVIEVKGWYPNTIERADNAEVVVNARGQREVCKHPVR